MPQFEISKRCLLYYQIEIGSHLHTSSQRHRGRQLELPASLHRSASGLGAGHDDGNPFPDLHRRFRGNLGELKSLLW
jgi:hypothetical protein